MEASLIVLAEISVGLAGFSSVVVVFRRRTSSGAWRPEDAFRFKVMLEAGLAAGLFAVLPAAVSGLGLDAARLWPLLSAILLAYVIFDIVRRRRQVARLPRGSLRRSLLGLVAVASFVVVGVQLLNIANWFVPRGPGPYLFGVTWLTVYSGLTFYRLVTAPIATSDPPDPPTG